jgi:hypothetical protein
MYREYIKDNLQQQCWIRNCLLTVVVDKKVIA